MTFIAGYKRLNTVHLVADSAVTVESTRDDVPLPQSKELVSSAFGEKHVEERNKRIHTRGLKIIRVSEKVTAAYAGDIDTSLAFLSALKTHLAVAPDDPEATISELLAKYRHPNDVHLIFGVVANSETLLLSYNDRMTFSRALARVDFSFAGNTDDRFNEMVSEVMIFLMDEGIEMPDDAFLAALCSFIQSITVQLYILENGYGGAILGIYMSPTNVEWLKQTLYVIYSNDMRSRNGDDVRLVQIKVLPDDSVLKISTHEREFAHTVELILQKSDPFRLEITEEMLNDYKFMVFLNSTVHYVLLLGQNAIQQAKSKGAFKLQYLPTGYDLYLGPNLTDHLTNPDLKGQNAGFSYLH